MYFPGKLVYLIVRASNQLAVIHDCKLYLYLVGTYVKADLSSYKPPPFLF